MSFSTLGLSDAIVRAVTERGYTEPTPIQLQAIPAVLSGGDLLAGAQTGTGKTAGFTLPILHLLSETSHVEGSHVEGTHVEGNHDRASDLRPSHQYSSNQRPSNQRPSSQRPSNKISQPRRRSPIRALILTPTRELAAQVEDSVREYGKYLPLTSMTIFGGVGMQPQVQRLKGGVDILVATPGRLLDHVQQGTVDLSRVEILVLDEADRMLDMGFIRDIRRILALLPNQRQNLLFSATFSSDIKAFAATLLDRPTMIEAARRHLTADTVAQKVYPVDRDKKRQLLTHLIQQHNWFQVLVFTRTKHGADRLVKQLTEDRIPSLAIHGNKSQAARTRALAKFKDGSLQVLVATDIAARGIDISDLPYVVNFELPNVPEDYVHRIGRTGRAGSVGEAASLVCVDELRLLADIERLIKQPLPREIVPGFEPNPHAKPEPIQNGQRGQASRGKRPDRAPSRASHASPQPRTARYADGERGERSPVSRRPSSRH